MKELCQLMSSSCQTINAPSHGFQSHQISTLAAAALASSRSHMAGRHEEHMCHTHCLRLWLLCLNRLKSMHSCMQQ